MKKTFKNSLSIFAVMFVLAAIMVGIGVATDEATLINRIAEGLFVSLVFSSPLVILTMLVSGIGTLINQNPEKHKREFSDYNFDHQDDYQLEEIMRRLSPEQQVYLENRLRNSRLGVHTDDGELMSLDDLMDEFDHDEKRL